MQWVEKYRPSNLNEISTQNNIIESLKNGIHTKNIPHLIFYGSSGCGKTSTILALAKELFGEKNMNSRVIELNASDERGINVIREKIKLYAKLAVNNDPNIPPWKIIILDEADTMTADSQFALRRIIEEYSKITRFCFICNYHNKIIDPIISRCSLFCFKPITDNDILDRLKYICGKENFNCSDNLLNKIVKFSRGDLRKAINFLQKCYNYYDNIDNENILEEVSGILPDNIFKEIITCIFEKNLEKIDNIIKQVYNDGYSLVNQIILFHDFIINSNLNNKQKSNIILKLVDIDQNLIRGCDEYIQFIRLAYYIVNILCE
jgi:replication factor C subunit 2/4